MQLDNTCQFQINLYVDLAKNKSEALIGSWKKYLSSVINSCHKHEAHWIPPEKMDLSLESIENQ